MPWIHGFEKSLGIKNEDQRLSLEGLFFCSQRLMFFESSSKINSRGIKMEFKLNMKRPRCVCWHTHGTHSIRSKAKRCLELSCGCKAYEAMKLKAENGA